MSTHPALASAAHAARWPAAARRLLHLLERLPVGQLALRLPDGTALHLPEPVSYTHLRAPRDS